ncbi:bifunctional DNA primase/polymerase [Streptomyces sp. NPDC087420]|uniref:bifunctional DNA primase/polymerase n=1 Tax=Streptomyces sp. NPDC087420 TaxID=3365785 RepID=UPI0038327BC2
MGFTIGGTRRRGRGTTECTAVAEYTGLWGWDVALGSPDGPGDEVPAGATLADVTKVWSESPGAPVLLPVGRSFDVIDVSATAGSRALVRLERMGLPLGPVLATPCGRAYFFVAPGAAAELPQLLYRMGWDDAGLDLRCQGSGHVPAPPTEIPGRGPVRWLRPPSLDTGATPPQARLLLGTLAYICHRSAA